MNDNRGLDYAALMGAAGIYYTMFYGLAMAVVVSIAVAYAVVVALFYVAVWLVVHRKLVFRIIAIPFKGLYKLVYWAVKLPVMTMFFVSDFIAFTVALLIAGSYYAYERVRYA